MFSLDWSARAHRELRSFPTRRSSDLDAGGERADRIPPGQYLTDGFPVLSAGPTPQERTGKPSVRDRKSTRLNSSHRCISYAVFCLKKKTYTRDIIQRHRTVGQAQQSY